MSGSAIIVFDGNCVLCSRWAQFVLRFDRSPHFRMAAMQTEVGRAILMSQGLEPDDPSSFVVLDGRNAYRDSTALIQVLRHCGWRWRAIAGLLRVCPRRWRDLCYRLIARNRYRWFGQQALCIVPDPAHSDRFIR